jgi:integrase
MLSNPKGSLKMTPQENTEVDEIQLWEELFTTMDENEELEQKNIELSLKVREEQLKDEFKVFSPSYRKEHPSADKAEVVKAFFKKKERDVYGTSLVLPSHKDDPYALWSGKDPEPRDKKNISSILDIACEDARFYDAMEAVTAAIPENTARARSGDIRYWEAWRRGMNIPGNRPLTPQELLIFVVDHAEGFLSPESQEVERRLVEQGNKSTFGPRKWSTISRRLDTLSKYADCNQWPVNPTKDKGFKAALRQLSKKYASNDQPRAITRNILIHLLDHTSNDTIGIRDRALLAFIFASGGRRRVEAEQARIEHLEDQGDCFLFHMQRSKNNKTGKSEPKPITGVAAQYLRDWLAILAEKEGPLFRSITKSGIIKPTALKGAFISRIVKKLSLKGGYDPKEFSAHSLRSGFVSQAAREGCSIPEVKALTGHRTDAMVSRYYQQGDVLRSKAGNLL